MYVGHKNVKAELWLNIAEKLTIMKVKQVIKKT